MTLKEFNDFGRVLDFTFDNAPVLGAPEPDDNYVTLLWNIHHKIPGADWTHIAAISCLTISNPLDSLHDGTRFDLYPAPGSLLTDVEIRIFAKSIYQIDRLPTIVEWYHSSSKGTQNQSHCPRSDSILKGTYRLIQHRRRDTEKDH